MDKDITLFEKTKALLLERKESAKGETWTAIAKSIGKKPSVISFIINDKTENVSDEMLLSIYNELTGKSLSKKKPIINTATFQNISAACALMQDRGRMAGIYGGSGFGKSVALKNYCNNNPNVFLLPCESSQNKRQFFEKMCQELGIPASGNDNDKINQISKKLNSLHKPLLIIDEAGKMSHTLLLYFHDLKDKTNAGIILCGVDYFRDNLLKGVVKNKQGLPELYNRISTWYALEAPTKAEIIAIAQANGITDETDIKRLTIAKDLRTLDNYIVNLLTEQAEQN